MADYHGAPPHHFIIEEPIHEHGSETFHGREAGYIYKEHDVGPHHPFYHEDSHDPSLHHGETFGLHKEADHFEKERRDYHDFEAHHETYIEPVIHYSDHEEIMPVAVLGQVDYVLDDAGHVHFNHDIEEEHHSATFLQ